MIDIENETFQIELTNIDNNFSIGFCEQSSLTFFKNKEELIQVEFEAYIPWVIDSTLPINDIPWIMDGPPIYNNPWIIDGSPIRNNP